MSQFTTEQRHTIYQQALNILGQSSPYMCDCIDEACINKGHKEDNYDPAWILENFPEFQQQKPKEEDIVGLGWFPTHDQQSRVNVLTKCIELTK